MAPDVAGGTRRGLQLVLGHMGEGLPSLLWRIDWSLKRPGNKKIEFREQFCEHFHITTSGNFSDTALLSAIMDPASATLRGDRAEIMSGNAERLFGIGAGTDEQGGNSHGLSW